MFDPHFRARITLRTEKQGGRKTPVYLFNYRPDIRFPFDHEFSYGLSFGWESSDISPGESRDLDIQIRSEASNVMPFVKEDTAFYLVEGSTIIADAVVLSIYRSDD